MLAFRKAERRRRGSCNYFLNDSTPRGQLGTSGDLPPSLLPLFGNLYVKLGSLRQGRTLSLVDSEHDFKQVSSASTAESSEFSEIKQLRILLKHIRRRDKFIIPNRLGDLHMWQLLCGN